MIIIWQKWQSFFHNLSNRYKKICGNLNNVGKTCQFADFSTRTVADFSISNFNHGVWKKWLKWLIL